MLFVQISENISSKEIDLMSSYYYLAASLGELKLDVKPSISFVNFLDDAALYLSKKDMQYLSVLREFIDIENIRRLFLEQSIDDRGNFNEKELDEAVLGRIDLPEYALDFLSDHSSEEARLKHFAFLYAAFFNTHKNTGNTFLDAYLNFEHQLVLWQALFRAKILNIDFKEVLQYEDLNDPMIIAMLVQSQNTDLIVPEEFKALKDAFELNDNDPLSLYKKTEQLRLSKITELVQDKYFTIDIILGFASSLLIIEKWHAMSAQEGINRLNQFTMKQ